VFPVVRLEVVCVEGPSLGHLADCVVEELGLGHVPLLKEFTGLDKHLVNAASLFAPNHFATLAHDPATLFAH